MPWQFRAALSLSEAEPVVMKGLTNLKKQTLNSNLLYWLYWKMQLTGEATSVSGQIAL